MSQAQYEALVRAVAANAAALHAAQANSAKTTTGTTKPTTSHPAAPSPTPRADGSCASGCHAGGGISPTSYSSAIRTCYAPIDFSHASQWAVPNSCYGTIYYPNAAALPARPSFGWCNWLPEESHLNYAGSSVLYLPKHWDAPRVGAVVWFNPGVQGAGGAGHWANLVAIGSNGWGLIEEMNFSWRGGGFGRIDYRFVKLYDPGVAYLYA